MEHIRSTSLETGSPDNATRHIELETIRSGVCSGQNNMDMDSFLLKRLKEYESPCLMVRTYLWDMKTLSLGCHQPQRDRTDLKARYAFAEKLPLEALPVVIRPTGGRAILHGEDISFAFITNDPRMLRRSLKDSYCLMSGWLKDTLKTLDIALLDEANECTAGNTEYTRSAVCFETRTPSDILAVNGQKIAGCAQARRSWGLLQHGSAFLTPVTSKTASQLEPAFSEALFRRVQWAIENHEF